MHTHIHTHARTIDFNDDDNDDDGYQVIYGQNYDDNNNVEADDSVGMSSSYAPENNDEKQNRIFRLAMTIS